jgi:hypothetical protein
MTAYNIQLTDSNNFLAQRNMDDTFDSNFKIPFFGARKAAQKLLDEVIDLRKQRDEIRGHLERLGAMDIVELAKRRTLLLSELAQRESEISSQRATAKADEDKLRQRLTELQRAIVLTEETGVLQESGVYKYRHPLATAVKYEKRLGDIEDKIKEMTKKDGGAIHAATSWSVNGSEVQGRAMVRDISKLMLRAFNAEADNLVRTLKPHKLEASVDRLEKVAETIERLGKTMGIKVSTSYMKLRVTELELTADFIHKQAEDREAERVERERLREERKAQQEIERERARLEKEQKHYENALNALVAKGDEAGAARLRGELAEVARAIEDVNLREANIRAGYVYVISNIGSFGDSVVKIGMTRRLDPMDRIRELSDASVPFNFDVHALFFSKDAVGIEAAMHEQFAGVRINRVNYRREFFRASPVEVKAHLATLAGELLEFQETAEALEYRQCLAQKSAIAA